MGRLINGINGPVQGKVGTLIGSSRNGISYVKGPYKKRTKRVSKKELANRNKFAAAQHWLQPVLAFVREGFKGYSQRAQGFVAAKSWLLKNAFEGTGPEASINPALVKLSFGDLPLPGDIAVGLSAPGKLEFTWDPATVAGTHPKDQVMLVAYDIKNRQATFFTTGQFRNAGADILPIPTAKGKTLHLYLGFCAHDRGSQSESVYLGEWKT